MRHEDFARRAADRLEEMAQSTLREELRVGYGITTMRSNEMRVAAHVVRALSEVVTKEEEEASSGADFITLSADG
jgi:hypothetical protein